MRQLQLEAEEHRKQKKRQSVSGLHRLARGLPPPGDSLGALPLSALRLLASENQCLAGVSSGEGGPLAHPLSAWDRGQGRGQPGPPAGIGPLGGPGNVPLP